MDKEAVDETRKRLSEVQLKTPPHNKEEAIELSDSENENIGACTGGTEDILVRVPPTNYKPGIIGCKRSSDTEDQETEKNTKKIRSAEMNKPKENSQAQGAGNDLEMDMDGDKSNGDEEQVHSSIQDNQSSMEFDGGDQDKAEDMQEGASDARGTEKRHGKKQNKAKEKNSISHNTDLESTNRNSKEQRHEGQASQNRIQRYS